MHRTCQYYLPTQLKAKWDRFFLPNAHLSVPHGLIQRLFRHGHMFTPEPWMEFIHLQSSLQTNPQSQQVPFPLPLPSPSLSWSLSRLDHRSSVEHHVLSLLHQGDRCDWLVRPLIVSEKTVAYRESTGTSVL